MREKVSVLLGLCLVCLWSTSAQAAIVGGKFERFAQALIVGGKFERFALVIGNAAYANQPLVIPEKDAADMAEVLQGVGFQATQLQDATLPQMARAVDELRATLSANKNATGLFYFSGYGAMVEGRDYLIPLIPREIELLDLSTYMLRSKILPLQWVVDSLAKAGNALNIVILDTSRHGLNDLSPVERAVLEVASGMVIAFATEPGQIALGAVSGDEGAGSPYTKHLVAQLRVPGLPIEEIFRRVRDDVMQEVPQQHPTTWFTLSGTFHFIPPAAPTSDEE